MKRETFKMIRRFISVLFFTGTVIARYHSISSDRVFHDQVNKYEYTLVCFVEKRPDEDMDRNDRRSHKELVRKFSNTMRAASNSGYYEDLLENDVGFLMVDISASRAEEIEDEFGIEKTPSCMLFKNGQPVTVANSKSYAWLLSPFTKAKMLGFIHDHFEDDIEKLIVVRKNEDEQEREERIARYNSYSRYGWGSGWYGPYWGHGYGSGFGYGYPYGYYGYGSRVGFGFRGCW